MILDSLVGPVRVCGFPAFWQGATPETLKGKELAFSGLAVARACGTPPETPASPRQTAFCKEEQRSQGAGKPCNRTGSAVAAMGMALTEIMPKRLVRLLIQVSGQLRNLGL